MLHIAVGRLFFVIGANVLLFIEVDHIEGCKLIRRSDSGMIPTETDSHSGSNQFLAAAKIIALRHNIGDKSGAFAGIDKDFVHAVVFANGHKGLIGKLSQGELFLTEGIVFGDPKADVCGHEDKFFMVGIAVTFLINNDVIVLNIGVVKIEHGLKRDVRVLRSVFNNGVRDKTAHGSNQHIDRAGICV